METNEIKKRLYKENPKAYFLEARKDGLVYTVLLNEPLSYRADVFEEKLTTEVILIRFIVPLNELGETIWKKEIEAKLLIRYLI